MYVCKMVEQVQIDRSKHDDYNIFYGSDIRSFNSIYKIIYLKGGFRL